VRVFFRAGQDNHLDVRLIGADEPSRGEAVELGHVQVHEYDVRAKPLRLLNSLASVVGLADHVHAARLEQASQSVAEESGDTAHAGRLRQRTQSLPGNVAIERLDVTDQASIVAAVAATLERFGHLDVLVNNAGVGVIGAMEVLDDSTLRGIFDTNLFGAAAVTRAVLPQMRH
jgi:NAD(P)-dependent dehydrogenase (short-subunit alcohol dehydrogenase family)